MSFGSILSTLLIGPLKLVFEVIFTIANSWINNPGLSIIFLSLAMNILVLPLYRRADAMQEASRDIEAKLHDGIAHIKKTFSGDERMMMLQTYYRQNNYSPLSALNGSISLLLEIPFFMAAYQFLSHLDILQGVSFGPIANLGAPDGMLVIGGVAINVLPILMTLVNVISSALYLKGFPLKTKIQLYAMAGFFLVFLYTSPAGLVFYWTLNNVFSLVKTIFYKIKNPKKVLSILLSVVGVAILVLAGLSIPTLSLKRELFLILLGVGLQLPILMPVIKRKLPPRKATVKMPNKGLFFVGTLFLTVLTGLLIPTTFIAASPQEYVDITYFNHPLWYVVSALCLAAGTFIVWFQVFYKLASDSGKVIFEKLVFIASILAFVNYMFFGTNLGVISPTLQYVDGMTFSVAEIGINFGVLLGLALLGYMLVKRWPKVVNGVLVTGCIALVCMSGLHTYTIASSVSDVTAAMQSDMGETLEINLSKKGKNVVVLTLDRALGNLLPHLMQEKPELKEAFAGFTYYANTVSFGGYTNFATPALLGGYEYTPVELNKRSEESLADKHNEALMVMPTIFAQNGYRVDVSDPVYAGYRWIPDLSIYDDHEGINPYVTTGRFGNQETKQTVIDNNMRNFFCFSIMKAMPLYFQTTVYDAGLYN